MSSFCSHALRGDAVLAALRPLLGSEGPPTQSVEDGIPTQSVGMKLSIVTPDIESAWAEISSLPSDGIGARGAQAGIGRPTTHRRGEAAVAVGFHRRSARSGR